MHVRAADDRQHDVVLVDARDLGACDASPQRHEAAGRIVQRLDEAWQRKHEAAERLRAGIGSLRAVERIGDNFHIRRVRAIVHAEDLATPDDVGVVIAFGGSRDFERRRDCRRRVPEYRRGAARERRGGEQERNAKEAMHVG